MKRSAKTLVVTLSVVVVGAVLLVPQKNVTGAATVMTASSPPVACRPVHGTIHSVFTTQNCASPVGLCTTGTITDAGLLDGSTTFTALAIAPSAGLPTVEPSANLSYSGQLTIVASNGTLVTKDLGVLDANHLAFTEIERPAAGTGVFANPGNSVFFISGSIVDNGQGFQGDLSGTVCASGN
jgi:hypothetical protein